ncbi:hypothetical protein [Pseudovibrio sp. Tun.PSC04-5.I4]|uniref:hypothetical protein n=1 Tax=Pseudovibrio sp. Tun.PSC04-5.I4 TaxID=1798213 RepID=UPI00190E7CFB|nr:hypothetical protein [Pseudovibrio sp. Tun.PSC04-5.I4]
MQHKLAKWAQDERTRRFDRLLRLIADRTWLTEAARGLGVERRKDPGRRWRGPRSFPTVSAGCILPKSAG